MPELKCLLYLQTKTLFATSSYRTFPREKPRTGSNPANLSTSDSPPESFGLLLHKSEMKWIMAHRHPLRYPITVHLVFNRSVRNCSSKYRIRPCHVFCESSDWSSVSSYFHLSKVATEAISSNLFGTIVGLNGAVVANSGKGYIVSLRSPIDPSFTLMKY